MYPNGLDFIGMHAENYSSLTWYRGQVTLSGICTERHVQFVVFFKIMELWNIYDCNFNKDNRLLGKPQELQQTRFQVTGCVSYRMNHLSDSCVQGWHRAFGTRLRFPAIHTCLNTERQGHLNLTVTAWPKHHGASQLECYIRRWKSKAFFFFVVIAQ